MANPLQDPSCNTISDAAAMKTFQNWVKILVFLAY